MERRRLLRYLGITPNYKGFYYLLSSLDIVYHDSESLTRVTKLLYPAVARIHHTSWKSVERDLRTVVNLSWNTNSGRLTKLAGYPMSCPPSVAAFIAIISEAELRRLQEQDQSGGGQQDRPDETERKRSPDA